MQEAEYRTIKELYEAVKDDDSASYDSFRRKLHRLLDGNVTTTNRILRSFGVEQDKPSATPTREFVAYDGEGENNRYILLANSLGEYIYNREDGLSTLECLQFLAQGYGTPVKRVFFSFGYDVNFIVKDFDDSQMEMLLSGKTVKYDKYSVWWIPGKMLTVNNFSYYDVFSFFTTSFINAIGSHLGWDAVSERLREGKSARGTFETWQIEKIIEYNAEELELLVKLMEKLRADFNHVGVNLQQWYGPGAVAKYWFKERGIKPQEKLTKGVIKALHSAYYGGRFEQIILGKVSQPYEYDLHSAYPAAMADMPYFTSWKPTKAFTDDEYSIWYVTFDLRYHHQRYGFRKEGDNRSPYAHSFMPMPVRSRDGHLAFPMIGKGWYWYSEVKVMMDYFPEGKITIHRGYLATTTGKPFAWVRDMYDERQRLKQEGNQAQFAIKVGLNSLYGKTAQRVGGAEFFSLAWAGYITSSTRAKLARAGYEIGSQHVLGFATDAIFTDAKAANLTLSNNLGDWEEQQFHHGIFFQSGVYRMVATDGTISDRYRGSPLRHGIDDIITQIDKKPWNRPSVKIGRFISNSLAIKAPKVYGPVRLQFVQVKHELALDSQVKRHYEFKTRFNTENGQIVSYQRHFKPLLTGRIESSPKVYIEDNSPFTYPELLFSEGEFRNIESHAPPMTDPGTMRLIAEAEDLAIEAGYDSLSELDALSVVEDPDDVSE